MSDEHRRQHSALLVGESVVQEGVVQIDPREIQPGDLMFRIVVPDGGAPSGWTLHTSGMVYRVADSGETLWPLPDFAVRNIL